jgi:hypothetical protein
MLRDIGGEERRIHERGLFIESKATICAIVVKSVLIVMLIVRQIRSLAGRGRSTLLSCAACLALI